MKFNLNDFKSALKFLLETISKKADVTGLKSPGLSIDKGAPHVELTDKGFIFRYNDRRGVISFGGSAIASIDNLSMKEVFYPDDVILSFFESADCITIEDLSAYWHDYKKQQAWNESRGAGKKLNFSSLSMEEIIVLREMEPQLEKITSGWVNETYKVLYDEPEPHLRHIRIGRRDHAPIEDFYVIQKIKNFVFGEDTEAFQVFPKEDDVVHGMNTHLWAFKPIPCVTDPIPLLCRTVVEQDEELTIIQLPNLKQVYDYE